MGAARSQAAWDRAHKPATEVVVAGGVEAIIKAQCLLHRSTAVDGGAEEVEEASSLTDDDEDDEKEEDDEDASTGEGRSAAKELLSASRAA